MDVLSFQMCTTLLSASLNSAEETFGINVDNLISVAGILVTALLGIISSVIAWKLGSRSIRKMKLNYNKELLRLIDYPQGEMNGVFNDVKISYGGNELSKPSLFLTNIKNTGNAGIGNPPILIRCKESSAARIFAGIIRDIPPGYESKWSIDQVDDNQFCAKLEHINPEQTVHAVFLVDNCMSVDEIDVLCPMQDVVLEQSLSDSEINQMISSFLEDRGFAGISVKVFRHMSNRIR